MPRRLSSRSSRSSSCPWEMSMHSHPQGVHTVSGRPALALLPFPRQQSKSPSCLPHPHFLPHLPPCPEASFQALSRQSFTYSPRGSCSSVRIHSGREALSQRVNLLPQKLDKKLRAEGRSRKETAVQEVGLTVTARACIVFIYVMPYRLATRSQPAFSWGGGVSVLNWIR